MSSDTEKWLIENKIDEVEAIVPDIAGVARGKFFPAGKFLKHNLRMPESIFIQGVTGDYGEVDDDRFEKIAKECLNRRFRFSGNI